MSGRRVLDAIQLLNVSKAVAAKHFAIRTRQLDVYTRTSSLTKGIKEQADGLILTAQAAAALARRFDDTSPPPPSASSPTTVSAEASADKSSPTSSSGSTTASPTTDNAAVQQNEAQFQVPASAAEYSGNEKPGELDVSQQQEVFYEPSTQTGSTGSASPEVKLPQSAETVQPGGGDGLNADVFHATTGPESHAKPTTEEIPEELMQGLFQNPRVSRALSGRPIPKRDWISADKKANPPISPNASPAVETTSTEAEMEKLGASVAQETAREAPLKKDAVPYQMLESRVPSSRLGRLWQYAGLGTSMAFGAVSETVRRAAGSQDTGSVMFSAGNMERMVAKLSKMRGAALKLGQMLSIQGMKAIS